MKNSYMADCLCGKAKPSDLDDYIEHWHSNDTGNSLSEFLGLTSGEYAIWIEGHGPAPDDIARARQLSLKQLADGVEE
jgi:hypothetical protein